MRKKNTSTKVMLTEVSKLEVSGRVQMYPSEVEDLTNLFNRYKGRDLESPNARLSAQANITVPRLLLDVTSSAKDLERGVYKISVLGPYTYISPCCSRNSR